MDAGDAVAFQGVCLGSNNEGNINTCLVTTTTSIAPGPPGKAKLLVQCPQLHPSPAADWCVSCPVDSWCHSTMQVLREHARWSWLRRAWIAAVAKR